MLHYEKDNYPKLKIIAGLDEAGRGCCAGPLVVACVIMPNEYINEEVNDSKKLSEPTREKLYKEIINYAIEYIIEIIPAKKVDELNPKQASRYGMKKCIIALQNKPELIITDFEKIDVKDYKQINLVKGDSISFNVACASILAKVTRDHIMLELDKKYPQYGFKKHKGYCTKMHTKALKIYGPCIEHRKTYKIVKNAL